jgi:hypothetical protein
MTRSGLILDAPLQQIRNILRVPNLIDPTAYSNGASYNIWTTSVGGPGSRVASASSRNGYVYQFVVQAGNASVYAYCATGATSGSMATPAQAGKRYTAVVRMRQTTGATLQPLYAGIVPRDVGGAGLSATNGTQVTPRALGEWTILRASGVMPTNTAFLQLQARANTFATGDTFEVDEAMVTEGNYLGDLSDGNTPGWKWLGTANASESRGYQYTLSSVVGGLKPALSLGSTPPSGSTTYPFVLPTSSFTVYSVQKDTAFVGADGFWQTNNPTQRTARLVAFSNGGIASMLAAPANAGVIGSGAGINPPAINVPHVYTVRLNNTVERITTNLDGTGTVNSDVGPPPTDAITDRIYVGSRDNTAAAIVTDALYVYPNVHTDAQVVAISRFLGNRHGIVTA